MIDLTVNYLCTTKKKQHRNNHLQERPLHLQDPCWLRNAVQIQYCNSSKREAKIVSAEHTLGFTANHDSATVCEDLPAACCHAAHLRFTPSFHTHLSGDHACSLISRKMLG